VRALQQRDQQGGQVGGLGGGHAGRGEPLRELIHPRGERGRGHLAQRLVGIGARAHGQRRDGAAAAGCRCLHHGPDGGKEGFDNGLRAVRRQRGEEGAHVAAVAGGRLGDDLGLAAGEVVVDRSPGAAARQQDIGERHSGDAALLQRAHRRLDHPGSRIARHRPHSLD
jgi:hypothetical protein